MNGIFALERLWWPTMPSQLTSHRQSVEPLLQYVCSEYGVKYVRYDCGTFAEMEHRLLHTRKTGYGILYLAFHGRRGKLKAENETRTIEDLALMMGQRFEGWDVHFASCSTMNISTQRIRKFRRQTGVLFVSGYIKDCDFIDAGALEVYWLSQLIEGKHSLTEKYLPLAESAGLEIF